MVKRKKLLQILLKCIVCLLSAVLLAFLCFALILAQPQPGDKPQSSPQPLLTASPAVSIQTESEMRSLVLSFPVPVMSFMSGSGMIFVSGTSSDITVNDGFGRVATLYWQTQDNEPLILESIYPASALSLLTSGYHFSSIAGPSLFGSSSVRMENADTVRIHATTDTGLYVVIVPKSLGPQVSVISRSLQLVTASR